MTTQFGPIAGSETESGGIPVEIDERTWPVEMTRRGNPQATRPGSTTTEASKPPSASGSTPRPQLPRRAQRPPESLPGR